MKKTDFLLILLALAAAAGIWLFYSAGAEQGLSAVVTVDGEWKAELPLEENGENSVTIETAGGYNVITAKDGAVFVTEADCRDQICVDHKHISKVGETIVCLPHKLVVEIVGDAPADVDAVVM